jgi:KipI family sensor histidine kinase inhibitor
VTAGARLHDYGDRAVLAECGGTDEVIQLAAAIAGAAIPGVLDVVPGARTVLVGFADPASCRSGRALLAALRAAGPAPEVPDDGPEVLLDVVYDGPDLAAVAGHTGMSTAEVVRAHTTLPWRVGFTGFAPGFAYLVGGDPRLAVPRRAEPRTRVPAGSVGLAGEFSGIYPRESPGGWQLIGRCDAVLWDLRRPQPALLTPGTRVRFRAAG